MNNKTDIDVQYVSPLKKICMTIGELPSSYLETMTYYEMLVWFTEFLKNNVIPTINNNAEAVQELQALYEELRIYVNDYFDNLDVQEEIDNKLDEMADSGQLTDIIAQYLGLAGMIAFDTVSDMKQAQNLVNGSKCRTLGYYSVNDGGGAYYKIRQVTNDDVVDEKFIIEVYDDLLVAELIFDNSLAINQIGGKANDSTFDNYDFYNALINNDKVQTIEFLKGTYYFSRLILKNTKNIIGVSSLNTIIQAMESNYSNFILLDYGPVAYLKISNLQINGNENNTGQNGLYIYGLPQQTGTAHGGMWYSIFENLLIRNFTKHQMYFEGNDPSQSALIVNQFCTFNNIYCYGNVNSEDVVRIERQQGQFLFNNCEFDNAPDGYYNLVVNNGDCLFNQLTCQNAQKGMYFSGSNIEINKIWVEGISNSIIDQVDNATTFGGITKISGGSVRNSATASGTYGFSYTARSILILEDISFRNSCLQTLFNNANTNNDIAFTNNCYFSAEPATLYTNSFYLGADTSGVVNIGTNRTFRLSPTADITNITFNDRAKDLEEINIYAHNDVTFSGSKFINPTTIAKNSVCKIIRLNKSMGKANEKFYILG